MKQNQTHEATVPLIKKKINVSLVSTKFHSRLLLLMALFLTVNYLVDTLVHVEQLNLQLQSCENEKLKIVVNIFVSEDKFGAFRSVD